MRNLFPKSARVAAFFIAAILLFANLRARAESLESVTNPRRANGSWVSDMAHVLDSATEARINATIKKLESETKAEMAVVTIRQVESGTPKQFATRLFNRWGIGKKRGDNGVLVLLVMDARRVEVETGKGMSNILPSGEVQDILQQRVIPRFKKDDYPGGIFAGVQALTAKIKNADSDPTPQKYATPTSGQTSVAVGDPFAGVVEAPSNSGYSGPSNGSGPSSDGGNTALGGLVLGGGLALPLGGLAWMKMRPRKCPRCQGKMRRLSESEDDAALAFDQRFEESIGSVDYRVWHCDACNMNTIERAPKLLSGYADCPQCRHRTVQSQTTIVQQPTYVSSGLSLVTSSCRFPNCNFRDQREHILPVRQRPSQSSSSGHFSSGSSFSSSSSHSSSSSDSSSSSSSGSDFGGGSSDGGGAGASW